MATILVVDDEPDIRNLLSEALTADGHTVHTVANGLEALDLVRCQPFDLTLLDLWLPGLNGLELVQRLQELAPGLPLALMTARPAAKTTILALRLGVDDYLPKPFDINELRATVERLLTAGHGVEEEQQRRAELLAHARPWLVEMEWVWARLTDREQEVLRLIAQGRTNKQIAQRLALSENTVEKHVGSMLDKLGVASRIEAALWAAQAGLQPPGQAFLAESVGKNDGFPP